MTAGKLFVISAPSGAGKTTLLKRVMARVPHLTFSVSHTTRPPRPGERDGVDYSFVSTAEFEEMIAANAFLEYARVHANLYGTSRMAVEKLQQQGQDVVLDIDVQGASILRREALACATYIFVAPPSLAELEKRLRGRGTEAEEMIAVRLANARKELAVMKDYEYLVVNQQVDESVELLTAIILAERARAHRLPDGRSIGDIGAI
jgi:guanylate kinase